MLTSIPYIMLELFSKYLNEQCSPQEVKDLLAYFSAEKKSVLRALITANQKDMDAEDKDGERRWNHVTDKIFAVIKMQINSEKEKVMPNAMVRVRR